MIKLTHSDLRPLPLLVAVAALIALTMQACHKKTDKTGDTGEVPVIDVAYVEVDSLLLHQSYPGYMRADKTIPIVARVDGTLVSQSYDDGQAVKAGQVLFVIDPTTYADKVAQAQAELATAQASAQYATSHYAAVRKALESDAVSQMEVQQAESDMNQAVASVKNAEAALRLARTNLSYCTISAPVSGHVAESTVSAGTYVNGGASPFTLATLYDDSSLKAVFSIEDSRHLKMISDLRGAGAAADTVLLTFDQPLPHTYRGVVNYLSPEVDTSTGTLLLKAKVSNPYGELRDGMFVTVSLPSAYASRAIMVKDASIGTDQLGRYVYTVNDSDKIVYTPVRVGELVNDTMRVVTQGLASGSRYVTKALLKVRSGETVKPRVVK